MSAFSTFKETNEATEKEQLRFNIKNGTASGTMNVLSFIDKDTKQRILYIPSLEITGYGETDKKANEMLQFVMVDFFKFIASLPPDRILAELSKFGWKKTVFHKEYSRIYADGSGELKNFNAGNNKVERLTLKAA